MIDNFNAKMWLGVPLNFHNICLIYPLTIEQYLAYSDVPAQDGMSFDYNAIFTQFMINRDFLKDAGVEYDGNIWDFFWMSKDQLAHLLWAITIVTHEDDIQVDVETRQLKFPSGQSLNASNYAEFADIVLRAHCFGQYQHVEKQVPKFKNKANYERWKKYQSMRQKYQKKDELDITQCVKVIQLNSPSFIPDSEILKWSYWKLLKWYNAVIQQSNYDDLQGCFAHWGGKDLRRTLDKLKEEIMTKI